MATFNIQRVDGSFKLFMATTRGVWIIPSFQIWVYVLHVEHISCVIMKCGQHQWAIPSLFSIVLEALLEKNITRKLLSLSWKKHYQKITIAIFSFVLQNCTIPGYFPYIPFYRYIFSSLFRLDQTSLGTLTIYQIKWELPKSHVETHIKTWQK